VSEAGDYVASCGKARVRVLPQSRRRAEKRSRVRLGGWKYMGAPNRAEILAKEAANAERLRNAGNSMNKHTRP
jgi:hypothetical protein